jgi:hypothetical protein
MVSIKYISNTHFIMTSVSGIAYRSVKLCIEDLQKCIEGITLSSINLAARLRGTTNYSVVTLPGKIRTDHLQNVKKTI